jgi:hypothetical protein
MSSGFTTPNQPIRARSPAAPVHPRVSRINNEDFEEFDALVRANPIPTLTLPVRRIVRVPGGAPRSFPVAFGRQTPPRLVRNQSNPPGASPRAESPMTPVRGRTVHPDPSRPRVRARDFSAGSQEPPAHRFRFE